MNMKSLEMIVAQMLLASFNLSPAHLLLLSSTPKEKEFITL